MTFKQPDSNHADEFPRTASNSNRTPERRFQRSRRGRRRFLQAAGTLAVAGLLAGCTGLGGGGNSDPDDDGPASVEEWLADTDNYDGVVDETGASAVTVEVGPESNEMVFAPAAIRVDPGTTVTWEWIGSGYHNVVAEDGLFASGGPEKGATFEYAFDAAGTTYYYCEPHRQAGMKGAVIVEDGSEGETATTEAGDE